MANTTISPNMNMPVPTVSVDPGPDWATNIDASLSIIDSHNHTTGQGVQITPDGMDINSDLSINENNLIDTTSVRFSAQNSPLSGSSDLGCIYESGVDLYYNDGVGNQIRITQSGSVTGSSGTISGLPSGTASASFAAGTFSFQSATNTPASMNQGPTKIGRADTSGFGVTVQSPNALASNYSLTFAPTLPASTGLVGISSSGALTYPVAQTGTANNDFTITQTSSNITYDLPDASTIARGAVTQLAQTFGGLKTFDAGLTSSALATINGRGLFNYATEHSGQIYTNLNMNINASSTSSLTIPGFGLVLVINENSGEFAGFICTTLSTVIGFQNSGWAVGTGAGTNNKLSFNSGVNVITITNNNGGTRTYGVFSITIA